MGQRFRCEECGRRVRGRPRVSVVGRKLCQSCSDNAFGVALGGMLGASQGGGLAEQMGLAAVFQRVLRYKREMEQRRKSGRRARAEEPQPRDPTATSGR